MGEMRSNAVLLVASLTAAAAAIAGNPASTATLWVHIDTWIGIPHSYATVGLAIAAAWHDLRYVKKLRVTLGEDQPLYQKTWASTREAELNNTGIPRYSLQYSSASCPDVVFRAAFPFNFSLPQQCTDTVLLLHATAETGRLWDIMQPASHFVPWQELGGWPRLAVVTPSRWSAAAFESAGIRPFVIPHGVGKHFRVGSFSAKAAARHMLNLDPSCVLLLTVGAATPNKGLPALLTALSAAAHTLPEEPRPPCIQLVIKAPSSVYQHAERRVREAVEGVPSHPAVTVLFHGRFLSPPDLATLYQAADLYITPYSAEGFNLPALEAAASGVPVLATGVGPVPEFLPPTVARFINARPEHRQGSPELFPYTCPRGGHCATLTYAQLDEVHFLQELRFLLAGSLHLRRRQQQPFLPHAAPPAHAQCPFQPHACALCEGNGTCVASAAAWLQQVPAAAASQLLDLTWNAAARDILSVARAVFADAQ